MGKIPASAWRPRQAVEFTFKWKHKHKRRATRGNGGRIVKSEQTRDGQLAVLADHSTEVQGETRPER